MAKSTKALILKAFSELLADHDFDKITVTMLVEKCKHTYKEGEHWMDLTLRGGEFVA